MPLQSKERVRKCREKINQDPEKRAAYLKKKRDQYHAKKKLISDLTPREKRLKRRMWKHQQKEYRRKKVQLKEKIVNVAESTSFNITPPSSSFNITPPSIQKKRGRMAVKRDRAKCYKKVKQLKKKVELRDRTIWKLRKQLERLAKSKNSNVSSPRAKVCKEIRGEKLSKNIKKKLILQETVLSQMKKNYTQSTKSKKALYSLSGLFLKKYKLLTIARNYFGTHSIEFKKKEMAPQKIQKDKIAAIRRFYLRDDNSRIANGKKLTVTKNKQKEQKRLLMDMNKALHLKFLAENVTYSISYSTFIRYRPFYVVAPTQKDRDTCMCRVDENLQLMFFTAKKLNLIPHINSISKIPMDFTCNINSKECMYRECQRCKNKELILQKTIDSNHEVEFEQWELVRESREKVNQRAGTVDSYEVKVTKKEKQVLPFFEYISKFSEMSVKYCKHFFNTNHQYKQLRILHTSLKNNEVIIHIDFSENYNLKYSKHIQSAHFGSSLEQVTLHTGVIYGLGEQKSFCSISSNNCHGPPAIWCHLEPVLDFIKELNNKVVNLHFWSDSPSSQYRQKGNFYLMSSKIYDKGFLSVIWNYFEAGHGRGAPDGVGGALKRTADRLVSNGEDITSAEMLFTKLKPITTVKLFLIPGNVINEAYKNIPILKPVPGTLQIHNVWSFKPYEINYSILSCYCCSNQRKCTCYSVKNYTFTKHLVTDEPVYKPTQQPEEVVEELAETTVNHALCRNSLIQQLEGLSPTIIDKWVIVRYEGQFYPGKVQDVDEVGVSVNAMHSAGKYKNKFFWPRKSDILCYNFEDVVTIMSEPNRLDSGHVEIPIKLWEEVQGIKK